MKVDWHPYPEEKPFREDSYLVTRKSVLPRDEGRVFVGTLPWDEEDEQWRYCYNAPVLAWANLPEPYEPPKRDPYYNHPDEITARKYMERDPETLKALGIFD